MKYLLFSLLISCGFNTKHKVEIIGVWVPAEIEWESPKTGDKEIDQFKYANFKTIYFYSDSNYILLSSTQSPTEDDSIHFESEPGCLLAKGKYEKKMDNTVILNQEIVFKTISGFENGNKIHKEDTLKLLEEDKLLFNHIKYEKARKYSKESIDKINKYKKIAMSN